MGKSLQTNKIPNYKEVQESCDEFVVKLIESANSLKEGLSVVNLDPTSASHWSNLINEWKNDKSMPLYVRKFNEKFPRGSKIKHRSGRTIVPCDNGPAHWSFSMCFNSNLILIEDLNNLILEDKVPIAMILKSYEKNSDYKCTHHEIDQPNLKGWKIAHKRSIGLNTRTPLDQIDIALIEEHFVNFLNPINMFLIPLKYAGFAEIEEVIKIFS